MHALIVHAHPEPRSFNGALTSAARAALEADGWDVVVSDLYAEGFDPLEGPSGYRDRLDGETFSALAEQRHAWERGTLPADVAREIERLKAADLVVLQFPLWWHGPPAILKGWMDRVFVSGGLYDSRMRYDRGFFRGRRAVCSVTTGAPAAAFGPGARGGDVETMLWPVQYSLHYMGFSVLEPFLSHGVQGHGYSYRGEDENAAELRRQVDGWTGALSRLDLRPRLSFPGWSDWDRLGQARGGSSGSVGSAA